MNKKLLLGAVAALGLLTLTGCGKSAEVDSKNIIEMDGAKVSAQEFFDDIKEEHIKELIDKMDHKLLDDEYKETDEEDRYVEEQINTLKTTYANGDDETFESIISSAETNSILSLQKLGETQQTIFLPSLSILIKS